MDVIHCNIFRQAFIETFVSPLSLPECIRLSWNSHSFKHLRQALSGCAAPRNQRKVRTELGVSCALSCSTFIPRHGMLFTYCSATETAGLESTILVRWWYQTLSIVNASMDGSFACGWSVRGSDEIPTVYKPSRSTVVQDFGSCLSMQDYASSCTSKLVFLIWGPPKKWLKREGDPKKWRKSHWLLLGTDHKDWVDLWELDRVFHGAHSLQKCCKLCRRGGDCKRCDGTGFLSLPLLLWCG